MPRYSTAVTAGIWINLFGAPRKPVDQQTAAHLAAGEVEPHAASVHDASHAHSHAHDHVEADHGPEREQARPAAAAKAARRVYHYAFHQLLDDTSYWVVLGIVLSGIVAAAVPATFFEQYLNNELASMLVMLAHRHPDLRLRFGSHTVGRRAW